MILKVIKNTFPDKSGNHNGYNTDNHNSSKAFQLMYP